MLRHIPYRLLHRAGLLITLAALLLGALACQPEELEISVDDLPPGDAANGAALFEARIDGAPSCASCHAIDGSPRSGPSLAGYGAAAGDHVDDQDAVTYTFYSILRPTKHITQGYSNVMPDDYDDKLSQQQIADLIAYLLTL